ncbi:MAG TPA: hypothetical protein VF230_18345, partial [Acidimicrobiales bacterium]
MSIALPPSISLSTRPIAGAVPIALAGAAAVVLAVADNPWTAGVVGLVVAVAAGLALHVDLPWGGRLTLGHAVLIALVARIDEPVGAIVIAGLGVVLALPSWLEHAEEGSLLVRLGGALSAFAATVAAVGSRLVLDLVLPGDLDPDLHTMLYAGLTGVVFLAADHVARALVGRRFGERSNLRQAWPLYVTLLCVAALIDVAMRRSVGLAFVAIVPLLVTRYAFQRYTTARVTYEQTAKALSLLPEVAGLTPLGHGERTASYVEAVAPDLGFDPPRTQQLATAARLHHIGHISLHEPEERDGPPDPAELATVSGEILQETGFLADLALLVGDCQPGGPPTTTLDGAVIRVCSTLDELVELDDATDPFANLVALH